MADNQLARWMGGSPFWVLVRLVLLSVVVGVILAALGLDPLNILSSLERLVRHLFNFSFEAIERLWRYFILGAVIVIPLWLILRIANRGR
ncbi:integrase [Ancylobacter dichloromethanicus]|uniref:DUF6460 domain-containing protein n=1 Tax=Ancylobacter dichloromethanicus TaxID=518825 RepID=A0A9W6MZQ9_9HYPH|nr:DUF6460 domain-containing protein [Ancylobacter dichloromethanicus]MBS7555071.1 integrase [Ancylobacter dichloromethanicus]GLK72280.1 hypothetical protein GCM10017643_23960 [Ancylobacter dichloromethanicus]